MWQTFGNSNISVSYYNLKGLTRKNSFFEGCSWFKFNNSALGMVLKLYTSVEKELKLKVKKFWGLIPTFIEVIGEKLVRGLFALPSLMGLNSSMAHWIKGMSACWQFRTNHLQGCIDQILKMWCDSNRYYEKKNDHHNEWLDLVDKY